MTTTLDLQDARKLATHAQGLRSVPDDESVEGTLERTGWVRTLGGVAAYLALSARNPSATVARVNEAVAGSQTAISRVIG